MTNDGRRVYDSFVVRIWRDVASGDCQRIEVEHVQTAQLDHAAGVAPDWILQRIADHLDVSRAAAQPRSDGRPETPTR